MGKYDFTNLRNAIVQNEIPQEQTHNVAPVNPLLNDYIAPRPVVDTSSEYYKAGQLAKKNALIDSYETQRRESARPHSSDPYEEHYLTAKDNLDFAKQNLNYATDPMQESQMRKELQMAQLAYDAAKKELAQSKLKEANLITEEQAAGVEPITPRNGRNYEGVGKKAQNPDKLGTKDQLPDISNLNQLSLQQGVQPLTELNPGRANQAGYRAANTVTGAVKGFGADVANAAGTVVRGMGESSASANPAVLKAQGLSDAEIKAELEKASSQNKGQRMVNAGTSVQNASDRLAQSSAEDINQAKLGLNGVGRLAVDIGSNAIQMGGDALAAVLTGGTVNPLTSMFARSAGGAAREARNEGASTAQQLTYGAVRGGIEVATEKMFDGLAGLYGKGGADDIVESVIGKLAGSSDAGKTALRTLFSGIGEAVEEGVSGVTEPLTQAIYKGIRSIPEGYNKEQASEVLYSMLVGFAMGGAGGAVNILNGGNAEANAKLNEAAQTTEQNTNPRAGMPSEAWEQQNVNQNPLVPRNGRNYEGVGQKAQNPEKAAARAAEPSQVNIDNTNSQSYNDLLNNGGNSDDTGRSIGEDSTGIPGVYENSGTDAEGRGGSGEVPVNSGLVLLSQESLDTLKGRGVIPVEVNETTTDNAAFSSALADAHNADARNGWAVTTKSAEELNEAGTRTFMNKEGNAGFAVAPDGDIEAVFANKAKGAPKGVTKTTIPTAIANGGTKLDCYGPELVRLYEQYGFVPVARVTFNPEYANEGWTPDKGTPDIYFMMHNGDSADTVVQKNGTYQSSTKEQLDALPVMEYDEAYKYRDDLLAQRGNNGGTPPGDDGNASSGENWTGDEVQTQSTFHRQLTEEEKARDELNPENDTHVQHHDEEVDSFAQNRITEKGHEGAREDIMSRDPADWDDVDVRTAQMLLTEELENARKLTGEEQDAAYRRIAELKNAYNKQGTEQARALRQRQRFGGTETDIVTEAAAVLYGEENQKNLRKMSPDAKSELMQTIEDYAHKRETRQAGDTASLIDMIKELNEKRRTAGLLNKKTSGIMSWFLDLTAKQEGGEEFLNNILGQQIRGLANDQVKAKTGDVVKTIRFNNMLSNAATIVRNFVANPIMDLSEAISTDIGVLADIALSKVTGTRSVAWDSGWFSKHKRAGSSEAFIRSVIEEGLDAPLESTGKYEEVRQGRTFKMDARGALSPIERVLSTWTKYLNYGLKSTDEFAKGGIRESTQAGLDRLYNKGKISDKGYSELQDRADYVAKERTLQKEGGLAKAFTGIRKATGIVGEQLLPFAQVPANATEMAINYTPAGILNTVLEVGKAIKSGKLTADQQAKIVTSIGRNANAMGLMAGAFFLALKGVIRTSQEDDKDKAALEKSEGLSGTQLNLSALGRLLSGEDSSMREGDELLGLGFLEYLSASMALGAALADDYIEDGKITAKEFAVDNLGAIFESFLSLPAVSQISSAIDAYNYSDAETSGGKVADAAIAMGGSIASGYVVPNWLRGVTKGLDQNERVTYTGDNFQNNVNYLMSGIPGLREKLPVKVDALGNEVKRGDNPLVNFLNATVMPGEIKEYTPHDVTKEIERVSEATGRSVYPNRNAPSKITSGDKSFELTTEEKTKFLEDSGKKTDEYLKQLFGSKYYQSLTDEQKREAIAEMEGLAIDVTKSDYLKGKGEKYSSNRLSLLLGAEKSGTAFDKTALDPSNFAAYTAFKIGLDAAIDNDDYAAIDRYVNEHGRLNSNLQTVLSERNSVLRALTKWKDAGLDSKTYYTVQQELVKSQQKLDKSQKTGSAVELDALANVNLPEATKKKLIDSLDDYGSKTVKGVYDILYDYGFNSKQINDFWNMSQDWVYKDTGDAQSSQKQGTLQPLEAYYAIEQLPGLDDNQKTDIYNRMKEVANVPYKINDWGNYTFASERSYYQSGRSKQEFGASSNPLYSGQGQTQSTQRQAQHPNYILEALGLTG